MEQNAWTGASNAKNCYQKANKYILQIYLKTISIKKESLDNKPLIG